MRIAIGSDHRGFTLKTHLIKILNQAAHEVVDVGTDNDQSIDYPDVAAAVGKHVSEQQVERGILICEPASACRSRQTNSPVYGPLPAIISKWQNPAANTTT